MIKPDLSNAKDRREYFRNREGGPTDQLIVETIRESVSRIVQAGYRGGGAFTTGQLTQPLWDQRPNDHHYIAQQMSRLVEEYDLPIRKVATKSDNHVLWVILFEKL